MRGFNAIEWNVNQSFEDFWGSIITLNRIGTCDDQPYIQP